MTPSFGPSAPNIGRATALILGLIVMICVAMIGGTGYLKFQMDRAETLLAAPDDAVGSDQDQFDRLRRILGYGGFLGLAQNYATKHDASGFADMKADIKAADDIVAHLPDKTSAETRHDLVAIVSSFDNALQKISAPANDLNGDFAPADLVPLYAALPILDARVASGNAEARLAAQNRMQFWGMLLTLVSWCSLIIASGCAAGIYLTLRDKHSAPMRALAQSIQNMARGDMRTAIWGIERQDQIGELARAVDIARYHFSHLPDLSLLSEQGPVRMRFEGGTRSLFEAMMKAISRDSENIRDQTLSLTDAVRQQKESIALMSEKVETVLRNILQHGQDGDHQIRQAIQDMVGAAENLKNAHGHAADQLTRLIPSMQDRADGMAEIAQITGKQVAQTLQSLTVSEINLKATTEHTKDTLSRLSSTADSLGERLFGAINLLQASGKVLAETTETMQSARGDAGGMAQAAPAPVALEPLMQRLEQIGKQLADMQGKLTAPSAPVTASTAATAAPEIFPAQPSPAFEAAIADIQNRIENFGKHLEQQTAQAALAAAQSDAANDKFDLALLSGFAQLLAERVDPKFSALEESLGPKFSALAKSLDPKFSSLEESLGPQFLALEKSLAPKFSVLEESLGPKLSASLQAISGGGAELQAKLDELGLMLAGQMQKKFDDLTAGIGQHMLNVTEHSGALSLQTRNSIVELGDKIAAIAGALPGGLRQNLQEDLQQLVAQIDTLRTGFDRIVAEKIEPHLFTVGRAMAQQTRDIIDGNLTSALQTRESIIDLGGKLVDMIQSLPQDVRQHMEEDWQRLSAQMDEARKIAAATQTEVEKPMQFPPELQKQMHDHWFEMAAQIEASRASIDKLFTEQVAGKLAAVEQGLAATRMAAETVRDDLAKPPKNAVAPELQKQLHDHWFQVAAQIEASRASLAETISHQIEMMESRVAGKSSPALSRAAADYATQRQIEQQTQILSELVATLGVLDAHMQQIKSEIRAGEK